jgi:hypothetical protein
MIANRLLVRHKGGYLLVEDVASQAQYGTSTQLLALGDIDDPAEARRVAEAHLATLAQPEREIDSALDPLNPLAVGARPWLDFGLGDMVTAPSRDGTPTTYRVVGWAISEDDHGRVTVEPTLNTLIDEAQIATQRWLRRMTPGALGGRSEAASLPVPADSIVTRRALTSQATFSFSGVLAADEVSSIWRPTDDGRLVAGIATLETRDAAEAVVVRLHKQTGPGARRHDQLGCDRGADHRRRAVGQDRRGEGVDRLDRCR